MSQTESASVAVKDREIRTDRSSDHVAFSRGPMEISSDESWDSEEDSADRKDIKPKYVGNFFEADRFNPVYLNDSIITWSKLPRVKLPISDSCVQSPNVFYVQFEHMREQLKLLNEKLNEYGQTMDPISYTYSLSEACLVCHENEWRRGTVLERQSPKIFEDRWSYKVHFLDYGSVGDAQPENMRPLIRSFFHTPVQAYCCTLDISPISGVWSEEGIDYFKEIMASKLVKTIGVIKNQGNGRLVVNLEVEVPNATKRANVGKSLIEKGYAIAKEQD